MSSALTHTDSKRQLEDKVELTTPKRQKTTHATDERVTTIAATSIPKPDLSAFISSSENAVNPTHTTPHTEAFHAVVWHLIVSHPDLKLSQTKWESVK